MSISEVLLGVKLFEKWKQTFQAKFKLFKLRNSNSFILLLSVLHNWIRLDNFNMMGLCAFVTLTCDRFSIVATFCLINECETDQK